MLRIVILILVCLLFVSEARVTKLKREVERKEIEITSVQKNGYDNLLEQVRLREHELNNHMLAIYSAHHTCETYEKLVETQREYCHRMTKENFYNKLLFMENKVLAGFLYEKMIDIENQSVKVGYRISGETEINKISTYDLIEMTGILLDNALEALKENDDKRLFVEVGGFNKLITVRNINSYAPYEQIQGWFEKGASTKGELRGLGLYHLKKICMKNGLNICCENVEIDDTNWIQFSLIFI